VIVDSLVFLGESLFGPAVTADGLLAWMDALEVDMAVVAPLRPRDYHLGPANDAVAAAVRAHPQRLVGLGRVDPNLGEAAAAEAERCLGELSSVGLFLHPWEETFRVNGPGVAEIVPDGVPVVVAAGYPWLSEGLQVGDLARRRDGRPVIATNGGQLNISGLGQTDVELALAASENLVLQTSGVYREDFLEGVVSRFGAGRLLYASSYPWLDPRLELLRVRWAHLDDAAKAAVLGGNAQRLLLGARS
jgi:predicted TIM-barrel fold metal-dependent hydrolase